MHRILTRTQIDWQRHRFSCSCSCHRATVQPLSGRAENLEKVEGHPRSGGEFEFETKSRQVWFVHVCRAIWLLIVVFVEPSYPKRPTSLIMMALYIQS